MQIPDTSPFKRTEVRAYPGLLVCPVFFNEGIPVRVDRLQRRLRLICTSHKYYQAMC